jgi:alpha-tubulin suppressor-like RCC1 family protein
MKSSTISLLGLMALYAAGCHDERQLPTDPASGAPAALDAVQAAPVFYQLVVAGFHSCGAATDGSAWCWGIGLLGDGPGGQSLTPTRVLGGRTFRQVSADDDHTCGVTTDFQAFCWGTNGRGQLGDGTTIPRTVPTAVAGGHLFYQVDAGGGHTCGVSYPDRRGYCWGQNFAGQLGDGTQTDRHAPKLVAGGLVFRHVSAGADFTCAVTTSDRAWCWGTDTYGQLGDGPTAARHNRPVAVAGGFAFRQLEAGTAHTCAVTTAAVAYCWGYGRLGQLGDGKTILRFTPRAVNTSVRFRRVAPGSGFTCAETPTSQVYCWGLNEFGQVGDGTTIQRLTPVPVIGGLRFGQVGAGGWNACGKTPDGVGYCWGRNDVGQLGDGTTVERHAPTRIAAPATAEARAAAAAKLGTQPLLEVDTLAHSD